MIRFYYLTLLVAFVAAASTGCSINFSDGYSFDYQGKTALLEDGGPLDAESMKALDIDNRFGDITIRQSAEARWEWRLETWATEKEDAEAYLALIQLEHELVGDVQRFNLILPEEKKLLRGVKSSLTLYVPSETTLNTSNTHGPTDISGIDAEVSVKNHHGDITVSEIGKACSIKAHHGDTVATNVGAMSMNLHHGDAQVTNGVGALNVDAHHSKLTAQSVTGIVNIDAHHGRITLDNIEGDVTVKSHHADIKLGTLSGNVEVNTHHGDARINVPSSDLLNISTNASHGDVDTDFESSPGAGRKINVKTSHGDIKIKKIVE